MALIGVVTVAAIALGGPATAHKRTTGSSLQLLGGYASTPKLIVAYGQVGSGKSKCRQNRKIRVVGGTTGGRKTLDVARSGKKGYFATEYPTAATNVKLNLSAKTLRRDRRHRHRCGKDSIEASKG